MQTRMTGQVLSLISHTQDSDVAQITNQCTRVASNVAIEYGEGFTKVLVIKHISQTSSPGTVGATARVPAAGTSATAEDHRPCARA